MRRLSFLLCALAGTAIARQPVPLMPPRLASIDTDVSSIEVSRPVPKAGSEGLAIGAELGATGIRDTTGGGPLGMDIDLGGRVVALVPLGLLYDRMYVKASLGYFMGSQSEATATVAEKSFEAGLIVECALVKSAGFRWFVGASQRGALIVETISVTTSSDTTTSFQYRLGPSSGIELPLSPEVSLTADGEVTFPFSVPVRTYVGATAGVVWHLR